MLTKHPEHGSPTHRALRPDDWWVTPDVEFNRKIEHNLQILAWQQTKDGQRGRNQPKPIPLPTDRIDVAGVDKIGGGEGFETVEEMEQFFHGHPWMPKD